MFQKGWFGDRIIYSNMNTPTRRATFDRSARKGCLLISAVVLAIAGGIYWEIELANSNAEKLGTSDVDLRNISLSSLEGRLGKHDKQDACRVPFGNTRFTNCRSYSWVGVADLWGVEPGTDVARVTFYYRYRGTFCGESVQQVRLKKNACGLPVAVDERGNIEYSNPLYHPAN
jgi:hypothetical protein